MKSVQIRLMAHLIALGFTGFSALGAAQTTGTTSTGITATRTAPAPATASNPTNKLVAEFTSLAGSRENATSLVNGLRTGADITLVEGSTLGGTGTTAGTATGTMTEITSTTFSPGTKPMGYGNIRIALSLARTQLASQGITDPDAAQLQGALVGTTNPDGSVNQGVLQMRAAGMGWGQIANSMGVKLGEVMSGRKTFTTASGTNSSGGATTPSGNSKSGRITTGAGTSARHSAGKSVVTGESGANAGNAHGKSGITNAAGNRVANGNAHVTSGYGAGAGAGGASGAVNAAGGKATGHSGVSNAGGHGKGKPF